ncbi:MAG: hypothetical protein WA906_06555 [Pacificimonas sp.]
MRRPTKNFVLLSLALALAAPVYAQSADALFRDGKFTAATVAARETGTVDGLALAARSALVVAAYESTSEAKAKALIADAIADADEALAKSPGNPDALLQKAIAIGYRAQLTNGRTDAKAARELMQQARKAAPKNPLAHASLGGWHSGAVGTLGSFIAGAALGAKKDAAIESFDRAVRLAPNDPTFRTFYAMGLVDIGRADETKQLRALLTPAAKATPKDGFEELIIARAQELLAVVDDEDKLEAVAETLKPFARIG